MVVVQVLRIATEQEKYDNKITAQMNCTLYFILPYHKTYFFKNLTLQFRSHTGNWQYFVINSQQVKTP